MAAFLFKTEPSDYSFADLARQKRCVWGGVTNAAALIHLRSVRKGDDVFIYHTGDERAVVGLARAATDAYEDLKKPGNTATGQPKFAVVDLVPVCAAKTPVALAAIKADKQFAKFGLVTQGRLSVMPVGAELDGVLRKMAGL